MHRHCMFGIVFINDWGFSFIICWWWNSNASPSRFSTTSPCSTITSPATSSPTSPSSSTPVPVIKQLMPPENDCGAVVPQYTVHALTFRGDTVNAQFSVSCDADLGGGDFMSFYSPSLTTCMHGCAMFNYWQTVYKNHLELNCSGVTYIPGAFAEGNCWFKPWGYNTAVTAKKSCSYARLNRWSWKSSAEGQGGEASWKKIHH